jgi:Tfp pilus tip-associated adhesin PilY1
VYDFGSPSERVIGKAALLGGYVFFTTYIPAKTTETTGCSTTTAVAGSGYLYIFDYRCRPFSDNPLPSLGTRADSGYLTTDGTGGGGSQFFGGKIGLGSGMPSQPVLDSKGESVIVQKSDAALKRIKVDPFGGGKKDGDIAGWTER